MRCESRTMSIHEFLIMLSQSLESIREPRFFQTERGYQGELLAELRKRLRDVALPGDPVVEQEYQKRIPDHEIKIRPGKPAERRRAYDPLSHARSGERLGTVRRPEYVWRQPADQRRSSSGTLIRLEHGVPVQHQKQVLADDRAEFNLLFGWDEHWQKGDISYARRGLRQFSNCRATSSWHRRRNTNRGNPVPHVQSPLDVDRSPAVLIRSLDNC